MSPGEAARGLRARGLKIDRGTLNRWRNGENTPSVDKLEVLRYLPDALGMSPAEKGEFLRAAGRALGFSVIAERLRPAPLTTLAQRIHFGAEVLPPFAGRQTELARLQELVRDQQSVLITGLGGMGKTRLAQELLHSSVSYFAHGCEYLAITAGQDSGQIIHNVAHLLTGSPPAADFHGRNSRMLLAGLRGQLAGASLLFLLDNVETSDQVRDLVRELPSITWVITARRLSLKSIGVYPVHLQLPAAEDATAIFRAHAGAAHASAVHAGEAHAGQTAGTRNGAELVADAVALAGRLPIALRLVAGLLANGVVTTPADLETWSREGGLLRPGNHSGKLHRLFEQLVDGAPPDAQAVFEVCGAFATRTIAMTRILSVCRGAGIQPAPTVWEALADLSLVDFPTDNQVALHPLLHDYARLRLERSASCAAVAESYRADYLALARSISDSVAEAQRDYWQLLPEESNLLEVAGAFYRDADWARLRLIWPALSGYLWNTGNHAGYEALDEQCLAAARATGDKEWEAVLLSELGFVAMERRDWAAAGELFAESQAIHDAIAGHALEQARLRRYRASLARHRGELDEALALLDECESRLAALSNPPESRLGMALVLLHSARMSVHHRRGELATAATAGLIADRHYQEIDSDDSHRLGEYKLQLGDILYLMGNDTAAREMWSEIVSLQEGESVLPEHAEAQLRMSWLAGKEGNREKALHLARDARQTLGRFGRVARVTRAEDLWSDLETGATLPSFADLIGGCDYPDY